MQLATAFSSLCHLHELCYLLPPSSTCFDTNQNMGTFENTWRNSMHLDQR
ncbi:hypothetical protein HanIR_Chr11g0556101 [Helianthus annuus]|nr:hypothetical protein HanIR_Chr11g0556101 [Helianthus annuus]